MELVHPLFKWLHIIAGITWIGLLYFFNWINGHVAGTMDADSKQKVVPELMPRALYWFRWGAFYTLITGIVLLYVIFWDGALSMGESAGNVMFEAGTDVTSFSHVLILFSLFAFFGFLCWFLACFLQEKILRRNIRSIVAVSYTHLTLPTKA